MKASKLWRGALVLCAPLVTLAVMAFTPRPAAAAASTVTGAVTVPTGADASHVQALLLDSAGSEVASVSVTDAAPSTTTGTYAFEDVANGSYKLYLIDPDGADDVAPVYYGGSTAFSAATSISVGGDYGVPTIAMSSGGEIGGLVFDANSGDDAIAVEACLIGPPDPGQAAYWGPAGGGQLCSSGSVASGSYAIGGLVPGASYVIDYTFANPAGGWSDDFYLAGHGVTADLGSATQFTPVAGSQLIETFSVPALGVISGVATNPGGLANTAMSVELVDSAGTALEPGAAFTGGVYSVGGLLPGAYRIEFLPDSPLIAPQYFAAAATLAAATPVTVGGGGVTGNVNVTLTSAASISGTVSAAQGGRAIGGIEVELLDAQGNQVASAFANPNGTYTLYGLPAGTWYLRFDGGRAYGGAYYATQYYGGSSTLAGSVPVLLSAGEALIDASQAMLAQSTTRPGAPKVSAGRMSGLYRNKVALRFKLTTGSGTAGYLKAFAIKLPEHIGWNKKQIGKLLVVPHDAFTYAIKRGQLVVTFKAGKKTANVQIKAGGITVTRGIESQAKARRIASEKIAVSSTDTTGLTTSLSFTVKKPH